MSKRVLTVTIERVPKRISPRDMARLDMRPADDGFVHLGPFRFLWREDLEAWIRDDQAVEPVAPGEEEQS